MLKCEQIRNAIELPSTKGRFQNKLQPQRHPNSKPETNQKITGVGMRNSTRFSRTVQFKVGF